MNPSVIREPSNFGKRKEAPTITICRNGTSRKYVVNPTLFSITCATIFMFMVGYFAATAYLILRDDLMGASKARYARTLHEYEDRIASLRSKLDRVTSRQMLDQQAIEAKVAELIGRQNRLSARGSQVKELLQKARKRGLAPIGKSTEMVPTKRPGETDTITTGSIDVTRPVTKLSSLADMGLRGSTINGQTSGGNTFEVDETLFNPDTAGKSGLFTQVAEAITEIDISQRNTIMELHQAASTKTQKIASVLSNAGISLPSNGASQTGGPFIPADEEVDFTKYLDVLDKSLENLDKMTWRAKSLPLGNPLPGHQISSGYGSRTDPFNGRRAMHAGIDFKGDYGSSIRATGNGKVIKAGRKGGYGKVVEIEHISGFVTRYAHMRRISVKVGQKVKRGQKIGEVGSTGRSTGPHLHYEVRKSGLATNPSRYLSTGRKLKKLL